MHDDGVDQPDESRRPAPGHGRDGSAPDPFGTRVIAIIRAIPPGSVTTYGIIAAAAGNHRGARQVARLLHTQSRRCGLPWHRVVNATGRVSPRRSGGHVDQRQRLEREGVDFDSGGGIDFDRFLWLPDGGP